MTSSAVSKRQPGLDLIRAVAIIWVMLFHTMSGNTHGIRGLVATPGWMGVDLFFALSGYLIGSQLMRSYAAGTPPSYGLFYFRRAFRILPAFLVVLGVYYIIPNFSEAAGIQPLWRFLTFTENLVFRVGDSRAFSHAWSLCVEEQFYLFFPLVGWLLMRKSSAQSTLIVAGAILVGGMMIRAILWLRINSALGVTGLHADYSAHWLEQIYYATYSRFDGLLFGLLVAAIKCFRPPLWARLSTKPYHVLAAGLALIAAALWLFTNRFSFWPTVIGYPILSMGAALLVTSMVSPHSLFSRVHIPGAYPLASIAYSLYLTHKEICHLVEYYFPKNWVGKNDLQSFLIYTAAILLGGALLYWTVERPFLRWRDRLERSYFKPLKKDSTAHVQARVSASLDRV